MPETVSGAGETEVAALRALWEALTGRPPDPDEDAKREALRRRLRMAYLEGAEEWARADGHPLTGDELDRAIARFPVTGRG